MSNNSLSVIQVMDGFDRLLYDSIEVVIMKSNCYVNVSHFMCQACIPVQNILQSDLVRSLIETLETINYGFGPFCYNDAYRFPSPSPVIEILAEIPCRYDTISGMYVHKSLLPYVLSYVSPFLAVKVCQIVEYYINGKIESKLRAESCVNRRLIELLEINNESHKRDTLAMRTNYEVTIRGLEELLEKMRENNLKVRRKVRMIKSLIEDAMNAES
ncbi:ORF-99 [Teiidae poxvirus 1]|nr:ORF-99 [Teiidae poxvirus 1]